MAERRPVKAMVVGSSPTPAVLKAPPPEAAFLVLSRRRRLERRVDRGVETGLDRRAVGDELGHVALSPGLRLSDRAVQSGEVELELLDRERLLGRVAAGGADRELGHERRQVVVLFGDALG